MFNKNVKIIQWIVFGHEMQPILLGIRQMAGSKSAGRPEL